MRITMLGTGHAVVTECYNTCFVLSDDGRHLLVDGGGGQTLLRQLKRAGIDWRNIHDIFVTHKHMDHITGILWMVRMICQAMEHGFYEGEARIVSHAEVLDLIRTIGHGLLAPQDARHIDERLQLVEVADGQTLELIGRPTTFFDIGSTKANQFGFCMELGDGRKLTCLGDEPCSQRCEPYVAGSTWLLHEAFCLWSEREVFRPYEKCHSTVRDACELAERLGAANLVLYHTEDVNIDRRKELYSQEGMRYFKGNIWVPDDLETLEL